jgi:hypothetical protein
MKIHDYEDAPEVIPDGHGLRVRAFLQDSGRGRRRTALADAIREIKQDMACWRDHRPMSCRDAVSPLDDPYDQQRPLPPNADPNGDDDSSGDEPMTAPPDHNDPDQMRKAFAARDRALFERDQRGNTAYMNPPSLYTTSNLSVPNNGVLDPRRADEVEAIRRRTVLR